MKAAMELIGVPLGTPYPPYASLTQEERAALAALLKTTALGKRQSVEAAEQVSRSGRIATIDVT